MARHVSRTCAVCGATYQGHTNSNTCSDECWKTRKRERSFRYSQRQLELDPEYQKKRYQRQLERDPEFNKKQRQRQLEHDPELDKKYHQRALERDPELYKKFYHRQLERDPQYFAKYRGFIRSRRLAAEIRYIITQLGPRITDERQ